MTKRWPATGASHADQPVRRIGALFGTPEQFATLFSVALIITPTKLHT
jgi:hypothetical protein